MLDAGEFRGSNRGQIRFHELELACGDAVHGMLDCPGTRDYDDGRRPGQDPGERQRMWGYTETAGHRLEHWMGR